MLNLTESTSRRRLEIKQRCASTAFVSLLCSFTLYIFPRSIFETEFYLYTAIAITILGGAIFCALYVRSLAFNRVLTIDDEGRLTQAGVGLFNTCNEYKCSDIHNIRLNERFGSRFIRIYFLYDRSLIFHSKQFSDVDAIDKINNAVNLFPLATRPKLPFPVTGISTALLFIYVFYATFNPNPMNQTFDAISNGAWVASRVIEGDFFRLIIYGFLHGSYLHLLQNVMILVLMAFAMEHLTGRLGFIALMGLGIIVSSLGGINAHYLVLVGASGGIYAIVGAYLWLRLFRPRTFVERFPFLKTRPFILILGFDVILGILIEPIALGVHIFGFLTGICYGLLFLNQKHQSNRQATGIIITVSLLFIGLSWSAWKVHQWVDQDNYRLATNWVGDQNSSETEIDASSWYIATSYLTKPMDLEVAINRIAKTSTPETKDTLATLYARAGDFSHAISIEGELVNNHYKKIYVSQLARFQLGSIERGFPIDLAYLELEGSAIADIICLEEGKQVFKRRQINSRESISSACRNGDAQLIGIYPSGSDQRKINRVALDPDVMALPL